MYPHSFLLPAKAGSDVAGEPEPRVTLAALAHPGLNSVAATRLIDADKANLTVGTFVGTLRCYFSVTE